MVRENVPLKKALEPKDKATIDAVVEDAADPPEGSGWEIYPDKDVEYIRGDIEPEIEK